MVLRNQFYYRLLHTQLHLDNTWGDTAKAIFNNWLGLIYRLTNLDRQQVFAEGIDPDDPLGVRNSAEFQPQPNRKSE